jgi:hypothetical protein
MGHYDKAKRIVVLKKNPFSKLLNFCEKEKKGFISTQTMLIFLPNLPPPSK